MKVILIIHKTQDADGCDKIAAVASSVEKAEALLGRIVRERKTFDADFMLREVEVDVDIAAVWRGDLGREIKEPVESVEA